MKISEELQGEIQKWKELYDYNQSHELCRNCCNTHDRCSCLEELANQILFVLTKNK